MTGLLRPLAGIVGFVVLAVAIGLNGLSAAWQQTDPSFSLRVNPLNADARVATIVATLNAGSSAADPGTKAEILAGLALAPGDARFYSLLGELASRRNEVQTSRSLYRYALETSKTEIHALLNSLDEAVAAADVANTVRLMDMTLRRWPRRWPSVQPLLPRIIGSAGGAEALLGALMEQPPWRSQVVRGLLDLPQGLPLVLELLAGELSSRTPVQQRDVARTLGVLVRAKLYAEAYRLFIITLTRSEQAVSGYVHNARFSAPLGEKAYTWTIARDVMADVSVAPEASPGAGGGLDVRFFDSPVRPGIASQRLGLPFGEYELTAIVTATGLKVPRSLFWRIWCERGPELVRLEVPEGTYSARVFRVDFSVGLQECAGQRLSLDTGVNNQSQRARYQGRVRFEQVSIARK